MRPAQALSRIALLLLVVTTIAACIGAMPPPPELTVMSPNRGLIQDAAGKVTVQGVARPGASGAAIAAVAVNKVPARLAADGSFTATVDVPVGLTLLETVATDVEGAAAVDARAVQAGALTPVGTNIERAVIASLSTDAFARLASAAGPIVKQTDFNKLLAPLQPMVNMGDSLANVKLSLTKLTLADATFELVPTDGGLAFSAELAGLSVAATAAYAGTLVPDGSTSIDLNADRLTIGGTLVVTPNGASGFTVKIASPNIGTTALELKATGLVGDILDLLTDNLSSVAGSIATSAAESAMEPLINAAFGALAGAQRFDVLGKQVEIEASPAAVAFSREGAALTMNLRTVVAGSERSPGYVLTPNGMPSLAPGDGIQLAIADDLINQLLAQVHALGLLEQKLKQDFGIFDEAELTVPFPPAVTAADGSLRLVLGDMVASFRDGGKPVLSAAVNASIELKVARGTRPEEVAIQFDEVHLFVNVLDPANLGFGGDEMQSAAAAGISLQIDSLNQFLVTVPVPAIAGVQLDSLELRGDAGYVIASGEVH